MIGIGLADTLYFRALNRLGAGRMGIVGNFYSPFVLVLSFVFLGERLSALQGVGSCWYRWRAGDRHAARLVRDRPPGNASRHRAGRAGLCQAGEAHAYSCR